MTTGNYGYYGGGFMAEATTGRGPWAVMVRFSSVVVARPVIVGRPFWGPRLGSTLWAASLWRGLSPWSVSSLLWTLSESWPKRPAASRDKCIPRRHSCMRIITIFLLIAMAAPACANEFRVGAAAVTITPPLGIPMAGYYSKRGATGSTTTFMQRPSSWNWAAPRRRWWRST